MTQLTHRNPLFSGPKKLSENIHNLVDASANADIVKASDDATNRTTTTNRRTKMTANAKATELKSKFFGLLNEYKDFAFAIHTAKVTNLDAKLTAHGQADTAACKLADLYGSMENELDLFFDFARDDADQSFPFTI